MLIALVFAAPTSARAQTRAGLRDQHGNSAAAASDTLPVHVIQRLIDAFNRHDATGVAAEYDETVTEELLGDQSQPVEVTRVQLDSAVRHDLPLTPSIHARLLQRIVAGPFVTDTYAMTGASGPNTHHLSVYEVRRGKIVRKLQYEYR